VEKKDYGQLFWYNTKAEDDAEVYIKVAKVSRGILLEKSGSNSIGKEGLKKRKRKGKKRSDAEGIVEETSKEVQNIKYGLWFILSRKTEKM